MHLRQFTKCMSVCVGYGDRDRDEAEWDGTLIAACCAQGNSNFAEVLCGPYVARILVQECVNSCLDLCVWVVYGETTIYGMHLWYVLCMLCVCWLAVIPTRQYVRRLFIPPGMCNAFILDAFSCLRICTICISVSSTSISDKLLFHACTNKPNTVHYSTNLLCI